MKKIIVFVLFSFVFNSCKDTNDMDLGPNIRLDSSPDQDYFVKDDSIYFRLTLSAINGINTLEVDHVTGNFPILRIGETTFKDASSQFIGFYYVIDSTENSGDTALLSFRIIDNNLLSDEIMYEYKVAEEIDTVTSIFGDQNNSNFGNCISLEDLKIYTIQEALQNPERIDFILYRDSVLSWALLSPNVGSGNDSLIAELSSFSTRKNTRFDRGIFSGSFSALNNDGPLVAIDSIPTRRYIDSISSISTFYFLSEENKRGLIQLRNFSDTLGNFGTLEIKVQR
ncbi:MAG: DUF4466 family protein [Cytophagales bacterium]